MKFIILICDSLELSIEQQQSNVDFIVTDYNDEIQTWSD